MVAIGCLYTEGFPQPTEPIKWKEDNKPVTSKPPTFPFVKSDTKYFLSSQLSISVDKWSNTRYSCSLNKQEKVLSNACEKDVLVDPTIEILISSCDKITGDKVPLVCMIFNFPSGNAHITWLKNGIALPNTNPESSLPKIKDRTFKMSITKESWDKEDIYTCLLKSSKNNMMKNISKCSACEKNTMKPVVKIERPSNEDIFDNKAKIICSVFGFNLKPENIILKINGNAIDKKMVEIEPQSVNPLKAKLSVSRKIWDEMENVSCVVKQPCSNPDIEETILLEKITADKVKTPLVSITKFMLPGDQAVTIICKASDFYPSDISILWENNGKSVKTDRYSNSPPTCTENNCSALGLLRTFPQEDITSYKCVVRHQSLDVPTKVTIDENSEKSLIIPDAKIVQPSFRDLFVNKSAEVSCSTNVPNTNITWVINKGKPEKMQGDKKVVTLSGIRWEKSILKVTLDVWKSISNLTCELKSPQDSKGKHLNIQNNFTQGANKPPLVNLLPPETKNITSEHQLTLVCLVKGFYPADLFVTWKVNGRASKKDTPDPREVSCDHQNQYCTFSSQLSISKHDWLNKTIYTCEVAHISLENYIRIDVSAPVEQSVVPDLQILKPSFKDLFIYRTAKMSCITNIANTSIKWMADEQTRQPLEIQEPATNSKVIGTQSTIQVTLDDWKKTSKFSCKLEYPQNVSKEEVFLMTNNSEGEIKPPVVQLLSPAPGSLLCLVSGFYPAQFFVTWELTNITVQEDENDPSKVKCDHQVKHCTYISLLQIAKNMWLNGKVYTCQVAHISSENYIRKNISIITDMIPYEPTPTIIYHEVEGEDLDDADDANNVWPTASTFIALFLLTLMYSSIVTFVKVK
ncbi:uncharacterized protein O3C94_012408 [Discoglossus pictus]